MKSQKFMLIALVLLAMVPGANPRDIFTGGTTIFLSQLYPALQETFRNYATSEAGQQAADAAATEAGQQAVNATAARLKVEVAAYTALNTDGAIVSYFKTGFGDDTLRQEIFEGKITQAEVNEVWKMINVFYDDTIGAGRSLMDILSTNPHTFFSKLPGFLKSLTEFTMIANCIGIVYGALCFVYKTTTFCTKVSLKTIRTFYTWLGESKLSIASPVACASANANAIEAAAVPGASEPGTEAAAAADMTAAIARDAAMAAAAAADDEATAKNSIMRLLSQIIKIPVEFNNLTIEELEQRDVLIERNMSADEYDKNIAPTIKALKRLGFNITGMNRNASETGRLSEPLPRGPQSQRAFSNSEIENRERNGGRTKKYLKKKQRKSVRKQRKTKRGKRGRSRKSRRYKK